MTWNYLRDFLFSIPAAAAFAFLFRSPRKAIPFSAVTGSLGYLIYDFVTPIFGSYMAGYFLGTFFIAICSEIFARIMKKPVIVFAVPAITPLVPGVGLYNTMMYLVEGKNNKAGQTGIETILAVVAMSMALVLATILTKIATDSKSVKKDNSNSIKERE